MAESPRTVAKSGRVATKFLVGKMGLVTSISVDCHCIGAVACLMMKFSAKNVRPPAKVPSLDDLNEFFIAVVGLFHSEECHFWAMRSMFWKVI